MPYKEDQAVKEYKDRRNRFNAYRAAIQDCALCQLLVESRKRTRFFHPTYGYGNVESKVVFVGEAPGRDGCAYTGIPFTKDRSGSLYTWVLEHYGLTHTDVYTTNIVKCWPADNDDNNRTPSPDECANCLPHFINELKVVRPDCIVCLGRVPQKILTDYKLANPNLGVLQVPIEYLPHPAFALRKGVSPGNDKAIEYASLYLKYLPIDGNVNGPKQTKFMP